MRLITIVFPMALIGFLLGQPIIGWSQSYDVDSTTGLRMDRYRAPVPIDVPGGITLNNEQALMHHQKQDLLFIDVYPPKGVGPDPIDGHWLSSEQRDSIPGAVWLPEVGQGTLTQAAEDYFTRNLERLTQQNRNTPMAFFCTSDCWQSWNAARRAINWGYTAVHWYPLGTDGWAESGQPLQRVEAVNFLDDTTPVVNPFPQRASIILINQNGDELNVGNVQFSNTESGVVGVEVSMTSDRFEDQFLSMRPFRCITDPGEWFCYLPYPYELKRTISADDLTDLEYQLLFIWKSPKTFGIDAWNGIYYDITLNEDGSMSGTLLQGDLNVLADPPERYSYPIDLYEFTEDGADNRLYPTLVIRP